MSASSLLVSAAIAALIWVGLYYGYRFIIIKNYLLGFEWIILGFSAANFFLYFNFEVQVPLYIATFCDAFSRTIGIPVIATLGILQITHGLKLPHAIEAGLFGLGGIIALLVLLVPSLQAMLPIGSVVLGAVFQITLLYIAIRLWRMNQFGHAAAVFVCMIALLFIAVIDGIVNIPDDQNNLFFNFYVLAHSVWALSFAEIFYACRLLESVEDKRRRGGLSLSPT